MLPGMQHCCAAFTHGLPVVQHELPLTFSPHLRLHVFEPSHVKFEPVHVPDAQQGCPWPPHGVHRPPPPASPTTHTSVLEMHWLLSQHGCPDAPCPGQSHSLPVPAALHIAPCVVHVRVEPSPRV
jgi:hypothetical protein